MRPPDPAGVKVEGGAGGRAGPHAACPPGGLAPPLSSIPWATRKGNATMARRIALSALQQRNFLTGTGRYIAEIFRALPAAGPGEEFLLYLKPSQRELYPEGGPNGKQHVMEGCPDSPLRRILWEWRNFCRQLREDEVDLYHGPSNFLPPRKVCPYVLTLHDMIYFRNPARTGYIKAKYWHYYTYSTWRQADLILTVSEYSAGEIQRFLPVPRERIRVVYNGVHQDYFVPAPEQTRADMRRAIGVERPYVLYVGRLDPDKNLPRLIRAFAQLVESGNRDHMLVLAGARDHRSDELPELAAELGIAERVVFPGYVAQEHLTAVYQEADVFCYPSLNEGFGLPVAEAMAGGTPVVTSNSSSIPEVTGPEAAILVDPESVQELASGLAEALRPERKRELSEAGKERAKRFTWEKAARETLAAYEEVLAR